jgi:excisionase family DNA binding protein
MSGKWLSVTDVATALHRSEADIRRMISEGRLPAYQFGKRKYSVKRADLELFIAKSRVGDPFREYLISESNSSDPAARETARVLLERNR